MFQGRTYQQKSGYRGWGIRFADVDGGVETTATMLPPVAVLTISLKRLAKVHSPWP